MKKLFTIVTFIACLMSPLFGNETIKSHDHHGEGKHEPHPGHGGEVLKAGDNTIVWYSHLEDKGKIIIHILEPDGKTPKTIKDAPRILLFIGKGRKVLKTTALVSDKEGSSSQFQVTNDALKGHVHGTIFVKVDGKAYQLKLIDHLH